MIKIEQLQKSFGSKNILIDINLHLQNGKVYGIVGENVAGKSTLFRCLARLETYTGTITSNHRVLKNHLGYLSAEPFFFDEMTGEEYLRLVCQAGVIMEEPWENHNIFDLPLKQYFSNYSTGMKKKLALLGILFQKNEYFILDEPFNGIDYHSNIIISELIKKLKKQ